MLNKLCFFLVFHILGCLWGALAQVWKRMQKMFETRPFKTLKIVFPCTREHSFHFRSATRKWCSFSPFVVSLWVTWPYSMEISGVFVCVFFLDRIYGCIVRFAGARVGVWGAQGRDLLGWICGLLNGSMVIISY